MQISKSTCFQLDIAINFNRCDLLKQNKLARFYLKISNHLLRF